MSFSDNRPYHDFVFRDLLGWPVEPRPRTAAEVLSDLRGFMRDRTIRHPQREAKRTTLGSGSALPSRAGSRFR